LPPRGGRPAGGVGFAETEAAGAARSPPPPVMNTASADDGTPTAATTAAMITVYLVNLNIVALTCPPGRWFCDVTNLRAEGRTAHRQGYPYCERRLPILHASPPRAGPKPRTSPRLASSRTDAAIFGEGTPGTVNSTGGVITAGDPLGTLAIDGSLTHASRVHCSSRSPPQARLQARTTHRSRRPGMSTSTRRSRPTSCCGSAPRAVVRG